MSTFLKRAEWTWDFLRCLGFLSLKVPGVISFLCVMAVLHKLALITKLYGYHFYASITSSVSALPFPSCVWLPWASYLNSASVASFVKWANNSRDLNGLLWGLNEMTYRWLTNTWKDAQHHSLSEKCKPKP